MLDSVLGLLYKSYSHRLYSRLVRVVRLFTDHLSQYYSTTGLPQAQVFVFSLSSLEHSHDFIRTCFFGLEIFREVPVYNYTCLI